MKFALLVRESKEVLARRKDASLRAAGMAYGEALKAAGVLVTGAGLQPSETAKMVTLRDGERVVQDGPYAESKEFIGGFLIIDVPDVETALEWAARHPVAPYAEIEVRAAFGFS
jgi:hypothetical protein